MSDTAESTTPSRIDRQHLRISAVDGAFTCVIAVLCIAIIRAFIGEYAIDDSYIGYDNAQNLAAGHGFAFNPDDNVLTTSAPLAVFLYAGISLVNHAPILEIAQTFAAIACLVVGLAGYALARRFAAAPGALAATIVLLGSPYTLLLWSHESYLCLAMLLVGLLLVEDGRHAGGAVVIGLAALLRPEAVLVVPFVAGRVWNRESWRHAVRTAALGISPLLVWTLVAFVHFGSFASQSIVAERAELAYNPVAPYLYGLFALPSQVLSLGYFQVIPNALYDAIALAWLGALAAGSLRTIHVVVVLGATAVIAEYVVLAVPFFIWFAMPVGVMLALTAALAWPIEPAADQARFAAWRSAADAIAKIGSVGIAAICLLFMLVSTGQIYRLLSYSRTLVMPLVDVSVYHQLGDWLAAHTKPTDTVAYPEIGQIRYYSGRSIVDFEGLVNRGVPAHVAVGDTIWAFKEYQPTVYVDQQAWYDFVDPTEFDWFDRAYRRTDRVPILMYPTLYNFDIYRLTDPSAIPPADNLDDRVQVQVVEMHAGGARIDFQPNASDMDQIDVRTIPWRGCAHGTLRLSESGGGPIARKRFTQPTTGTPVRLSLLFDSIERSQMKSYSVDISGCPGLALAPRTELRHVAPLETTLPSASVGPPSLSLSVYVR